MTLLDVMSIKKITNAISREATNTVMVLLCNSGTVGHCTLCNNSSEYVWNHALSLSIFF
jgi:hypothetical protein